jgi:heavy metal sensor kinase
MPLKSIRVRLTLWYAAALILGLGLFSSLVWLSLRQRLLSELDQDLAGRAARFEQYFRGESAEVGDNAQLRDEAQLKDELDEFCQALPPSSYVDLRGSSGFQFHYPESTSPRPESAAPRPESGSPRPESTAPRAANLRMSQRSFSSGGQNFDLEVGAPMADLTHTLQLLRLLLLSLLPVVIAIACLGGAWLSARALKPIHDITAAANAISIENLSERLPVPSTGDELARLTEVLNSMLARLESAVKRLSQFAADASHELRTPLAVIRTTAELALRRSRPPESYRESLSEIAAETERMTKLVEDLLTLARGGTEASQMPRSPLDLPALLREVCAELQSLAETRQIRIHPELPAAQPGDRAVTVSGNRPALRRLFVILLDNAIKYSPAGSGVRVTLTQEHDRASVTIEDSGAGISQADLPHIFERFYRAGEGEGHGIGLALADHIARAHGTTIEVRSFPGAFSVFRVSFPVSTSANLQIPALS